MNILADMFVWTRKWLLNFGSHPHMHPDVGFLKNSSTLRDKAFSTIWLKSLKKNYYYCYYYYYHFKLFRYFVI